MDYTTELVPPEAGRSAYYAPALHTSVIGCGLLLGMGGEVLGMVSWAIIGGNFPATGPAFRCDQTITTTGG